MDDITKVSQKVIFVSKEKVDEAIWEHWDVDLKRFLEKYHSKFDVKSIKEFKISIKELHVKKGRKEYSIDADFFTDLGNFFVKKEGWNPATVFHELIDVLGKQVFKKMDKEKTIDSKRER